MKCLIIAAGKGTRLAKMGDSKPLISLLGLSLIERVILTAKKGGMTDFYVVTGYKGEKVRPYLEKFSRRRKIKITNITNEEWEEGNGLSVFKAKELLLNGSFILLMADHIFDENILQRLKDEPLEDDQVILAVDYNINLNRLVDIADATKVFVDNNKIIDIGKHLTEYNAYDTGIFLCSSAIFTAIETSIVRNNDSSLSGGLKVLAQRGGVKAFDINDGFWIDLDDEKSFNNAEKCLINKLKKSSDGPVSRYFNRPISIKITRNLIKTNVSPNQISLFCFVLCSIASLFFFLGGYITLVTGAVLVQMSSIIDGCDGEVARLKHRESDFGRWFDAVLDRYADAFMLFGLTYHTFNLRGNILYLFIGFMAIIGSFMNSYTADKYDDLMKGRFKLKKEYFRIGRDVRIFIIFIGAGINQPILALLLIALLMNIENIRRVVVCYREG